MLESVRGFLFFLYNFVVLEDLAIVTAFNYQNSRYEMFARFVIICTIQKARATRMEERYFQ